MAAGTEHAGDACLQATVRVHRGATRPTMHTGIPSVHEAVGRSGAEGIHALVENESRQERREFSDKRGRRDGLQLGSRQNK